MPTVRSNIDDDVSPLHAKRATDDYDEEKGTIASSEESDVTPTIPTRILNVQYAVRGAVLNRAMEMEQDLTKYPFDKLTSCHIGNPHAVGIPATTYIREVMSLIVSPYLLSNPDKLALLYKQDNIERATRYLQYLKEPGAYTHAAGAVGFRNEIAEFMNRRDGVRPSVDHIFMSNGASDAIDTLLTCTIEDKSDGVMLPLPQYPLYTATISKLGGSAVFYELNESSGWNLEFNKLTESYCEAKKNGITVKLLVVICPGNPASTTLSYNEKKQMLEWCQNHNLPLLADEVYQDNVYDENHIPFVSFRKILLENNLQTRLISIHSSSKGLVGECGFRGGFMCLDKFDDQTLKIIYKMRSVTLCPNTMGQVVMACVTNPPALNDPSYSLYIQERTNVYNALKERADYVHQFFESLEDCSCQPITGALYAFPKFNFSEKAINAAKSANMSIDLYYCLMLLEKTGIITVPGDGFGEKKSTYHLRMTILPSMDQLKKVLPAYREFHNEFWNKHR